MLNNIKKNNKGFTIIEVMIVLAIAGLIILIVLLAVPALQRNGRNTGIKNDASAVAGGVGSFASNNDGAIPKGADSTTGTGVFTLANTAATAAPEPVKLQGSTVVNKGTDSDTAAVTIKAGELTVTFKTKCGVAGGTATAPTYTRVASARATSIIYATETAGSLKAQCLDA